MAREVFDKPKDFDPRMDPIVRVEARRLRDGRLSNHWIDLHEAGNVAGFRPVLVMGVWEHAFPLDYSLIGMTSSPWETARCWWAPTSDFRAMP